MKVQFRQRIFRMLAVICVLGALVMPAPTQAKSSAVNPLRLSSGVTAYAIQAGTDSIPANFVSFPLNDPESITTIKTTSRYIFAATFLVEYPAVMYVLINSINTLSRIDLATGVFITVGKSYPQTGEDWSGLTASADGTELIAASTTPDCETTPGGHSSLYSLDSNDGKATLIGAVDSPDYHTPCLKSIAMNSAGDLFGVDVGLDTGITHGLNYLVAINPTTGASRHLGPLADASAVTFGAPGGLVFDRPTGNLYLASWINPENPRMHLYTLTCLFNCAHPTLNDMGAFAPGFALSAMAIPVPDIPGDPPDKLVPANGAAGVPTNPTLTWRPTGVFDYFEYCIATTVTLSGTACDTGWKDAGANTIGVSLHGLITGQEYFWQVVASHAGGTDKYGDGGAWWHFTPGGSASYKEFLPSIVR